MYIPETHSTSSLIREQYMEREDGFYIVTDNQTAGRGQVGNHWEAEPGKNLTFSILLHRNWEIQRAWEINMAIALGIVDALREQPYYPNIQERLTIKWPNDIYIGDKKVCGTLIENFVSGTKIASSIVGIGLNINQTHFVSNAPNPTSLLLECSLIKEPAKEQKNETKETFELQPLLESILHAISTRLSQQNLREEYMSLLYRNDGRTYLWEADGEQFEAQLADISEVGELILAQKKNGTIWHRSFGQKQVRHVLPL